jgi:hypothetical protein
MRQMLLATDLKRRRLTLLPTRPAVRFLVSNGHRARERSHEMGAVFEGHLDGVRFGAESVTRAPD